MKNVSVETMISDSSGGLDDLLSEEAHILKSDKRKKRWKGVILDDDEYVLWVLYTSFKWPLLLWMSSIVMLVGISELILPLRFSAVLGINVASGMLVHWWYTRQLAWAVTTRRVIFRWGFFGKRGSSVSYTRITDVDVHRPFLCQIFGNGKVLVNTVAGSGDDLTIYGQANPDSIEALIRQCTDNDPIWRQRMEAQKILETRKKVLEAAYRITRERKHQKDIVDVHEIANHTGASLEEVKTQANLLKERGFFENFANGGVFELTSNGVDEAIKIVTGQPHDQFFSPTSGNTYGDSITVQGYRNIVVRDASHTNFQSGDSNTASVNHFEQKVDIEAVLDKIEALIQQELHADQKEEALDELKELREMVDQGVEKKRSWNLLLKSLGEKIATTAAITDIVGFIQSNPQLIEWFAPLLALVTL